MTDLTEVKNRADLRAWVTFPLDHYRGHPYHVPPLVADELAYFSPRNPVYRVARAKMLLARRDGAVVGRVCGILHALEEKKLGYKRGRFGWFECIEDEAVGRSMLDALQTWFREEGCVEMTGPHGFTDLDPEGVLVEGFDYPPTISGSYNYPYYAALLEACGFSKEVDYLEFRSVFPKEYPLFRRLQGKLAAEDALYTILPVNSRKHLMAYAPQVWDVLEESFEDLYGVTPLTTEQREFYTKKYFGFLDPDFVKLAWNRKEDRLAGFFIGMPNLSRGFRRAGGRLLPWGWAHILKDYRRPGAVDFLLAGVRKSEMKQTVFMTMMIAMYEACVRRGIREVETNRELETNTKVIGIWEKFERVHARRSRIYRKPV